MGRTIHWVINPREKSLFDKRDLRILYDISREVQDLCKWTCETFFPTPKLFPNLDTGKSWEFIEARTQEMLKSGLHPADIYIKLIEEETAFFFSPNWESSLNGFCKVAGNELNASVIIVGLTNISLAIDCSIKVNDEGKYLLCPIIIENGLARPNEDEIDTNIAYWMTRRRSPGYKDSGIDGEKLSKEHFDIKEKYESRHCPPQCEWPIETFCREINPEDFENHPEYSASEIMRGFSGVYFGLSAEDEEKASYLMSAMIKKILPKDSNIKLEVTSKNLK